MLEKPAAKDLAVLATAADPQGWEQVRRLITIHGLAPHLFRNCGAEALADSLAPDQLAWLAEQDTLNAQRIDRMHAELAAILAAAARSGIAVIPLKGAMLTTMPGTDPHRRPMGDLDLLVHAMDRRGMANLLADLGYRHEPEANPRPTHDVFVDRGRGRVVSRDEHPDNPRRVEVHVELLRHLWGWLDDDRLTEQMWASAQPAEVLGQPAFSAAMSDVLSHVAMHATADLLYGRGRLVQWLDIASLAGHGGVPAAGRTTFSGEPHRRLAYPSVSLARRVLPQAMAGVDFEPLEAHVPERLVRWARSVPLDHRSGLMISSQRRVPHSLAARAARWAPVPWRLTVAYGDRPPPVALGSPRALHGRPVARPLQLSRGGSGRRLISSR